jgi:hypothetical protein
MSYQQYPQESNYQQQPDYSQQQYDPSPQQQYDPSPQQYDYQQPGMQQSGAGYQYQASSQAHVQQVPTHGPPPRKGPSALLVVAIVIVVIVIVVASIVGALFLLVWSQSFSQGPGTSGPGIATISIVTFSNKEDGMHTNNSGGWSARIIKVTGPPTEYSDAVIKITVSGMTYYSGTISDSNVVKQENAINYYYFKNNKAPHSKYYDYETASLTDVTSSADIDPGEMENLEGCYLMVADNDGNGKVSAADAILVYKSNDCDGEIDIPSGSRLEITEDGISVGSTVLG